MPGKIWPKYEHACTNSYWDQRKKRKNYFIICINGGRSADNISVTHDLPKKQQEEIKELIKYAKRKEEGNQLGKLHVPGQRLTTGLVYKIDQQNLDTTKQGFKTVLHNISCFYTNADQFKRKFSELSDDIQNKQTLLIRMTEVKPKHSINKLYPGEFSNENIGYFDSQLQRNIKNRYQKRHIVICI